MSFNEKIPKAIEAAKRDLFLLREELENGIHDCNCAYCERSDDLTEAQQDDLTRAIREKKLEIARLNRYATLNGLLAV